MKIKEQLNNFLKKAARFVYLFIVLTAARLVIIGMLASFPGSGTTVSGYYSSGTAEPITSETDGENPSGSESLADPSDNGDEEGCIPAAGDGTNQGEGEVESGHPDLGDNPAKILEMIPYEDYSSIYSTSLFIGDSLTEGLSIYGYIDEANVIASKGMTIDRAAGEIENMASLNPRRIFLLFGTNDLLYGETGSQFAARYLDLAKRIHERLPETDIYAQSIFPVTLNVATDRPLLANWRIDEYNDALRDAFSENGFKYVDVSSDFKNGSGTMNTAYSPDGIHLYNEYYRLWLYKLTRAF